VAPLMIDYREARVAVTPELTGGPTLAHALRLLSERLQPDAEPNVQTYVAYAESLQEAYRHRLTRMGDVDGARAPGCTSHFCVVDEQGNIAAVTQTLLSVFGSRLTLQESGVLMNNGIMWFDPEPGKPNSLAPGKRCLGNYCPVVGETGDGRRFALGASGGRKIIGTVLQIASFLIDHRFTLEEAFHQPRIDMSGGERVIADRALPADTLRALEAAYPTSTARRTVYPYPFAVPAAVLREGDMNMGCTEIMSPWGDAVAERARAP
jgi:gamma-glutamyltranspeptidase/glutathione hydrolase